jgi:hypothetical protein
MHNSPRSYRRYAMVATAAATVMAVALVGVILRDDKRTPVNAGDHPTTSTSTTAVVVAAGPHYIWPFDNSVHYGSPAAVANGFAHEFLGMPDEPTSAYRAGDANSGEIDIYSYPGVIASTLTVRSEYGQGWKVVSADNQNLQLDSPHALAKISSPLKLTGKSVAFEGTVHVTLLGYGGGFSCQSCGGTPQHPFIATSTFTGHGTELTPFETTLTYGPTPAQFGLLMLWTDSARDGSLAGVTVRIVSFG